MMEVDQLKRGNPVNEQAVAWYLHPFFQYAFGVLLTLLIILVFYHVSVFIEPFLDFVSILFTPIVISLLFYYLLRPIVYFFETLKIPRLATILGIYLTLVVVFVIFIAYIAPILTKQISAVANISVQTWEKLSTSSEIVFLNYIKLHFDDEIKQRVLNYAQQMTSSLSKNLIEFFSFLTRLATILAVIPLIVFYFLKDDQNFVSKGMDRVPENYRMEIRKILINIDETLSSYITGLVLVSSIMGAMLFIGYLIIDLNYALILSMLAMIFMAIPFIGPFLAITPALLVAVSTSSWMVIKVIIVFAIIQQTESNFISPQIIGQRLNIHPLTIILLLLVAGSLYGLAGLFLITPLYALAKVLIGSCYKIYHWYSLCSKQ
ncbi:MAG: AI-2E family transporter [Parachlamydiaceae bacterium]